MEHSNTHPTFCDSVLDAIGQTPVIPLRNIVTPHSAQLFGKYEAGNPTSSLKDRIALALIKDFESKGLLLKNGTIVAATSGNSGVALSMVCAVRGYKLELFMPENVSLEKRKMFAAFGTRLHLTSAQESIDGAKKKLMEFLQAHPEAVYIDQFNHPATVEAHYQTTAQEILNDFPEGVDAFIMGVGTGSTITGVARLLKEKFPATKIIAVEPKVSAVLSGGPAGVSKIQQMGLGFIPQNLRLDLIDEIVTVADSDAYLMTARLAKKEGLLLGISSGANVSVALEVAKNLGPQQKVLTILCDAGQRYFSLKKFFEE